MFRSFRKAVAHRPPNTQRSLARERRPFLGVEVLEDRITPSHMRYLNLTCEPVTSDATNLTFEFHFQTAWRTTFYAGDGVVGNKVTFAANNGTLNFGDGSSTSVTIQILSVANGVTYGEAVRTISPGVYSEGLIHKYASAQNYVAFLKGDARISTLKNNHDATYRVETIANAGTSNSAPVSSQGPIVQVADNLVNTFGISAVDPDGDTITYRAATTAEAQGSGTYTIPTGITVNATTGLVTWDIRNSKVSTSAGNLWTFQVVVEDHDAQGNVKSKTPVDFILSVIDGSTNAAPVFDKPPTPTTSVNGVVGQAMSFTVQASDPNASDSVTLVGLNVPQGLGFAVVAPISGSRANAVAQRYSWTPATKGTYVITYQATDSRGRTALNAVTVRVFLGGLPGITITESGGSTDVAEGGATDDYTVMLNSQPSANVTVTLNPGTQLTVAPTTLTFTPANWDVAQTVVVTAVDDSMAQGDRTVPIAHTASSSDTDYNGLTRSVNVNITDNDVPGVTVIPTGTSTDVVEGGATDSYGVVLNTQPSASVTITLSPDNQVSVAPVTLTFTTSNWNTPQTVTVTAVDDDVFEGPHQGVIAHAAASGDSNYDGLTFNVTANITDNDAVGVIIVESGGFTYVAEGGAADTYTVRLTSQPLSDVTLTAQHDAQIAVNPLALVFSPGNWNVPQTVAVTAFADNITQGLRDTEISYTATSGDISYDQLGVTSVDVMINDAPQLKIVPQSGLFAVLEGRSRTYTAALGAAPIADVTMSLSADPQLVLSVSSLIFTPDNWNVPQLVTVTAVDNSVVDGNRTVNISDTATSGDPLYDGMSVPPLAVRIIDDDNTLLVEGTANPDQIDVLFSGPSNLIQVVVNKKSSFYAPTYSQVVVLAGSGNDTVHLGNPTIPVAVLGDVGADKVLIDGSTGINDFDVDAFTVTLNTIAVDLGDIENAVLNGKNASDTCTVLTVPTFPMVFQGFGGQDRLTAPDQTNVWKITGPDNGTLDGTITFNSVGNLVGGAGDDAFSFAAGKVVTGQVDGGGGNNSLDFSAYKTPVSANLQAGTITGTGGFRNIATLRGGAGLDKLVGADATSTWNITAANAGNVGGVNFASFENLVGGSLDDAFVLAAGVVLKGKIDGGAGADVLDYSSFQTSITVNLQAKTANSMAGWLNLEQFIGGTGSDKLIGTNKVNTWSLTGVGTGNMTGGFGFQDFENLTGGSMADTFDLSGGGDWLGLVDGGSGADVMIAPAGGVYTTTGPGAGTLNGRTFRGIETRQ